MVNGDIERFQTWSQLNEALQDENRVVVERSDLQGDDSENIRVLSGRDDPAWDVVSFRDPGKGRDHTYNNGDKPTAVYAVNKDEIGVRMHDGAESIFRMSPKLDRGSSDANESWSDFRQEVEDRGVAPPGAEIIIHVQPTG